MCEFHDANGNGLGDIWWTDKCRPICILVVGPILDGQMRHFVCILERIRPPL